VIYLITGAGEPNFGDELIALDWIKYYRAQGYTGPIFVDCKSGEGARKLHAGIEGVQFGRFLKALATGNDGSVSDYISRGRHFVDEALGKGKGDAASPALATLKKIAAADRPADFAATRFVHLVGGGYINGDWNNSFSLIGGASQLAKQLGCSVVATGLGIAPLDNLSTVDRISLANAIRDFDLFEVRDEISMQLLGKNGVKGAKVVVGLDDSFLQPPETRSTFEGRSLHLSLFGRHLDGEGGAKLMDLIKTLAKDYDRVLCWQCNAADEPACARIEAELDKVKRLYNRALLYNGMPIQAHDHMITSRFHPHLLAARSGISGLYLVYSNFYSAKHQSVVDLGSPFKRFVPGAEIDFSQPSPNPMLEMDGERVRQKRRVGKNLATRAKRACGA